MTWLLSLLTAIFKWDNTPTPSNPMETEPITVSNPPATTPVEAPKHPPTETSMLVRFCTSLRNFEGSPGDLNYRNKNPGNTRCSSVGYLPKYGNVKCVNNFAVFETYDLGWEYLLNLVHYRATEHPTWTILDFFTNWAPASDNNFPAKYAAYVAKDCGKDVHTTLKDLLLS